jgi:hypothetical protein
MIGGDLAAQIAQSHGLRAKHLHLRIYELAVQRQLENVTTTKHLEYCPGNSFRNSAVIATLFLIAPEGSSWALFYSDREAFQQVKPCGYR